MTKDEKFAILYAVVALVVSGWLKFHISKKVEKEAGDYFAALAEKQIARQRQWNT